ncbi:MAG TPA: glycosyltransferase family 2 protein [Thermoanaerobaculia bacterium]|nr:glycosyltransferase family 2 protein [Thermoanaerobaculia bacterium]
MARRPLSVLIHTFNEEELIADCLRSVSWADEIYLLDSFSTDRTVEIVRSEFPQVRIEQHRSLGSAAQKNYGMDRTRHDWVLVIDADERVIPALAAEIQSTLENPRLWAYSIGRRNFVLGEELRFSGLQNDRVNRLFHRAHARYPNRRVHADLVVDGPVGALRSRFDHLYVRSLEHMQAKMTRYGIWAAAQLFVDGKSAGVAEVFLRPMIRFLRDYIVQQGFRDGMRGLILVRMHAFYVFWKYAKLWEMRWQQRHGIEPVLPEMERDPAIWRRPWESSAPRAPIRAEPARREG